ncbi:hypothetical protein THAOC_26151 [Thalassiosira oceanica]|uniref:Uncharacterized protein n=1 Tax=Thalassiosira oceanica TaxID=159749 RepID=K0RZR1_THAOC|nr:hypothetical protein THAOC_26151 [Thalassiosira oceanica]|eukprot:EJK54246.1 hypothetical protein THAOC_26151 [Thalassiosira oceanica]
MVAESKLRPSQVTPGDAKRRRVQGTSSFAAVDADEGATSQAQIPPHQTQTSPSGNAAELVGVVHAIPTGAPLSAFGLANPQSDFATRRRHHEMQMNPILRIGKLSIRECESSAVVSHLCL